jgi:hypothetical protein
MLQQFRNDVFFAGVAFVLFGSALWAQHAYTNETEVDAIKHVKSLQVSSLDGNLPKVTLEFFLKYEGEGAPIKWSMSNCDQLKRNPVADDERDAAICGKAEVDLKGNRSATVVVSLGKPRTRPATVPSVFSVTVTGPNGSIRELRHLGDLPMELHRPLPKGPRDLPLPAAAA